VSPSGNVCLLTHSPVDRPEEKLDKVSALKYMNGRFLLQAFVEAYLMRRASGVGPFIEVQTASGSVPHPPEIVFR